MFVRFFSLCLLMLALWPAPACAESAEEASLRRAAADGAIVRLHILAEDDSPAAQARKLRVRDAVLAAYGEALAALPDSADAAYAWLQAHAEDMRLVAEDAARAEGFDGPVTAEVGWLTLPAKRYGAVLLPEGDYRGLRITLGAGEGRNWWCVLFPRLCLAAAGEEPWQAAERDEGAADAVPLRADSLKVLRCWLLWP